MNEHLRDRILRKLETLSDERGYQVLDYVEFLESRYAERQAPSANTFTKFTEAIEDKLRSANVSASAIFFDTDAPCTGCSFSSSTSAESMAGERRTTLLHCRAKSCR